jgi:SulP family sulfate permease
MSEVAAVPLLQGGDEPTRAAQLALAAALLVVVTTLNGLVGAMPVSVMAGVVVATMIGTLDPWSIGLARRLWALRADGGRLELMLDLGVVATVTILVVASGALPALAAGMGLSVVIFVWRSSGGSIRRSIDATRVRSETARTASAQEVLEAHGGSIRLVSLQGSLFFGSAEAVADRLDAVVDAETVILDFTRVATLDGTAIYVLKRIDGAMLKSRCRLLLAGLTPRQQALLADQGWEAPKRDGRLFDDANAALVAAEDRLLSSRQPDPEGVFTLADHPMLNGLTRGQRHLLETVAERRDFAGGDVILTEGECGDAVWLLAGGRLTAWRDGRRVAGFHSGTVFGERALLGQRERRETVVAEEAAITYRLPTEDWRSRWWCCCAPRRWRRRWRRSEPRVDAPPSAH